MRRRCGRCRSPCTTASPITENLRLDYGGSFDSVSYLDHVNSLNQFARLTYDLGAAGKVKVAYSSGRASGGTGYGAPRRRRACSGDSEALAQDLAALAVLPRLSLAGRAPGHPAVAGRRDWLREADSRHHPQFERVSREGEQRCDDRGCARRSICAGRSAAGHFVSEQHFRRRQLITVPGLRPRCRRRWAIRCKLAPRLAAAARWLPPVDGSDGERRPKRCGRGCRPCSVSGLPQGRRPDFR